MLPATDRNMTHQYHQYRDSCPVTLAATTKLTVISISGLDLSGLGLDTCHFGLDVESWP